jgi:hypothetical protein
MTLVLVHTLTNLFNTLIISLAMAGQSNFFVSPNGKGETCSQSAPCSIATAQSKVRSLNKNMPQDLTISFKGGTYTLSSPLTLGPSDSGFNGHNVIYTAAPGETPVLSGGYLVKDSWVLDNKDKNIYKAPVPKGFDTRQVYVNGVRAQRSRLLLQDSQGLGGGAVGFGNGWMLNIPDMSKWRNQKNIEMVSRLYWQQDRCPVNFIYAGSNELALASKNQFQPNIQNPLKFAGVGKQALVADFNADGKSDLFFVNPDAKGNLKNYVSLSKGSSFDTPSVWLPLQDSQTNILTGDFDGDKRADLLFPHLDAKARWHNSVALSTGTAFSQPRDWLPSQGQGTRIYVGNFDGDKQGTSDLLFTYTDGGGVWHNLVALSNGKSFQSAAEWLPYQGQGTQYYIGDFDGDGTSDLLFAWSDNFGVWHNSVATSTGSKFNGSVNWLDNEGLGKEYVIGDFNGDGATDLILRWTDGANITHNSIAFSKKDHFAEAIEFPLIANKDYHYLAGNFDDDPQHRSDIFAHKDQYVEMQNPCWLNANNDKHNIDHRMREGLNWIENAYEILSEPGQWYLDRSKNLLYYIPRADEKINQVKVVASQLDQLLVLSGNLNGSKPQFVQNVKFSNLVFSYATWLEANSSTGYAENQAGIHFGSNGNGEKTLGNISLSRTNNISLTGNQFLHLGGTALNIDQGSQNIQVIGNTFYDVSSGAVVLGDFWDGYQNDSHLQNKNLKFSNNYITQTGVEFESTVPILLGYTLNASVLQNEVDGSNYSGISLGWGWTQETSYAQGNLIQQNYIHDIMKTLSDGGGIYTLSNQANTVITGNNIENIGPLDHCPLNPAYSGYVGIYHDQGSTNYSVSQNVTRNNCGYWLMIQPGNHKNILNTNYVDIDQAWCNSAFGSSLQLCDYNHNDVSNLKVFGRNGTLPQGALDIVNAAGISGSYLYTKKIKRGAFY